MCILCIKLDVITNKAFIFRSSHIGERKKYIESLSSCKMFKHAITIDLDVHIEGVREEFKCLSRRICVSCIRYVIASEWNCCVDIDDIKFLKAGSTVDETCGICNLVSVQTFSAFEYVRAKLTGPQQQSIRLVSTKIGAQLWCEKCFNEQIRHTQEYISEDCLSNSRKCVVCRERCRIAKGRHYWLGHIE